MNKDNDIEAAAQDAVLREQVTHSNFRCFISLFGTYVNIVIFCLIGNCYPDNHLQPKVYILFFGDNFLILVEFVNNTSDVCVIILESQEAWREVLWITQTSSLVAMIPVL